MCVGFLKVHGWITHHSGTWWSSVFVYFIHCNFFCRIEDTILLNSWVRVVTPEGRRAMPLKGLAVMQMADAVAKGNLSDLNATRVPEQQDARVSRANPKLSLHALHASLRSRSTRVPQSPSGIFASPLLQQQQQSTPATATNLIISMPPRDAEVQAERRRVLQGSAEVTEQSLQELHRRFTKNRTAVGLR
jgi:hypothetical protein